MAVPTRRRVLSFLTATLSLLLGFLGCSSAVSRQPRAAATDGAPPVAGVAITPPAQTVTRPETTFPVMLGIDVLESEGFAAIRGKRIGLLTHPAGVNRHGVSTIDVLRRAPGVKLVALFAPEHGLYGTEEAGEKLRRFRRPAHRPPGSFPP